MEPLAALRYLPCLGCRS